MANLHATPISKRPANRSLLQAIAWAVFFNTGCLCINATQFLLLPLRFLPVPHAHDLYERGIRYTKGAFGLLCVLITQWFAPTSFVITYEGSEPASSVFERDPEGKVTRITLPEKLVLMANHQVYADWLYLWCLTYFMNAHDQVLIILKKSLKHLPIVGWGMQFYRFLFIARSWAADRSYLGKHLVNIGKSAQKSGEALSLMIFPEGTLVSQDTRPLSRKFADKTGIPDLDHMLLPRSTGLLFLLRTLGPAIPNLHVLDVTVGYPGIPPRGYGQDYYTLRSIFMQGVPPPKIHLHLRLYKQSDIPIGKVSSSDGFGRGAEASVEETARFDQWLRDRWTEKDQLMDTFYREGKFSTSTTMTAPIEVPIALRSNWEALDAFAGFAPVIAVGTYKWAKKWILS